MKHERHGMSRTRLYRIWIDMRSRCESKNNRFYYRYGGRGISVCEQWNKFSVFHEWAINNGYSDDLTIDRIDNDGDYCPENCKWSTQHEQSMNKTHLKSKTGFVGVRERAGKFQAEITRFQKYYYVGLFNTAEEAARARSAFMEAHGWS